MNVGPVFVDPATGNLVAMFPVKTAFSGRLTLQAEIEAHSNGTAQVIGACNAIPPQCGPTMVTADYARDWVRRWYAAGGKIRIGDHGYQLVQGFNSDAMIEEWPVVRAMVARLAAPRQTDGTRQRSRPRRRC